MLISHVLIQEIHGRFQAGMEDAQDERQVSLQQLLLLPGSSCHPEWTLLLHRLVLRTGSWPASGKRSVTTNIASTDHRWKIIAKEMNTQRNEYPTTHLDARVAGCKATDA